MTSVSSLRYGAVLKPARQIAKHGLKALYPIVRRIYRMPCVLSVDETLDAILDRRCSISRFGDGEFLYIVDRINLPFQAYDERLAAKMQTILAAPEDERILVGLPIGYHSFGNLRPEVRTFWRSQITWIYPRLQRHLDLNKTYHNSSITRFYNTYEDKSDCPRYLEKLMRIWEGRDVILVEGEKSRLGVGNDLFGRARSVKRILAPAHNAFARYDDLVAEVQKHDRSSLILIALGPTATAMAYDLSMDGYQAVDIGNVDIEYEWYRMGAKDKVKVPGKYTSEAVGGRIVEDVDDPAYAAQIVARIL